MLILKDIILILSLAILIILILSRFKIPPVNGFLITGVLIGPSALKLVDSVAEIETMAEIGVILLMFTIGLEFSKSKIKAILKDFFLFGGLQVFTGWIVFYLLLNWYGLEQHQSILGGFILSLSSTAIVLKLLQDRDELNSPSGLKMIAILLFQDAIIIPAMIVLPFVNQLRQAQPEAVLINIFIAFAGVILIYFGSKIILPKIFRLVLNLRIQDLLTVLVFVFLFGVAILGHELGISLAMGAFIVGFAISDTDYAHQINTDIIPSRHIFNSIFFISIGMFVNIAFFIDHIFEVTLITVILITVKIVLILAIFLISRTSLNTGFYTAFGLAHIGEFSFILLRIAQEQTLFTQDTHQILLSSAILSMFSIPIAMNIGKKLAGIERLKKAIPVKPSSQPMANHTIIAGYGVNGQNIGRILKLLDIPYLIVEMNSATVNKYKALGEPIFFGSIDRRINLHSMGISKAALIVIAINDTDAAERAVRQARTLNPTVKIIVRVNYLSQVEKLYQLGADLVLSQDLETSLIFIYHILKFYKIPDHVSRTQINLLREEHYQFFLKKESPEAWKIALLEFIEQDNELFFISAHSKHISKRLGELDPFHYNNMSIIGVIRQNKVLTDGLAEIKIEPFDSLIFCGNNQKVYEGLSWMEKHN